MHPEHGNERLAFGGAFKMQMHFQMQTLFFGPFSARVLLVNVSFASIFKLFCNTFFSPRL